MTSSVGRLVSRLLPTRSNNPLVTTVDFRGVIVGSTLPRPGSITIDQATKWIVQAFNPSQRQKAVALCIDCPGGSPATTELLHRSIRHYADKTKLPVYAFAEGTAASGGYWLMCAADEVYALNTSLVGSMGVLMSGWGATEAIKKLGIERRLLTAGKLKGLMDPFKEMAPEDEAVTRELLGDLHSSFQQVVLAARQGKLKGRQEDLFSGRVWTGRQAVELGLVDGVGDMRTVMREKFGDNVNFKLVNPVQRGIWSRWMGQEVSYLRHAAYAVGAEVTNAALDVLEARTSNGGSNLKLS